MCRELSGNPTTVGAALSASSWANGASRASASCSSSSAKHSRKPWPGTAPLSMSSPLLLLSSLPKSSPSMPRTSSSLPEPSLSESLPSVARAHGPAVPARTPSAAPAAMRRSPGEATPSPVPMPPAASTPSRPEARAKNPDSCEPNRASSSWATWALSQPKGPRDSPAGASLAVEVAADRACDCPVVRRRSNASNSSWRANISRSRSSAETSSQSSESFWSLQCSLKSTAFNNASDTQTFNNATRNGSSSEDCWRKARRQAGEDDRNCDGEEAACLTKASSPNHAVSAGSSESGSGQRKTAVALRVFCRNATSRPAARSAPKRSARSSAAKPAGRRQCFAEKRSGRLQRRPSKRAY
mmetsp:Transcript_120261/g.345726  ORF Transcript_120261/g.345726 Transcript_120261/m.345726 type:complete len:356 (-) Transcript_120261:652-1719(-)